MSQLLIVTRPELVSGFHLAGVEAYAAGDAATAQGLIARWLDEGETGLLAIDEDLMDAIDPAFQRRLAAADQLPHLLLPGGEAAETERSGQQRIAALLRRAIGFHITFHGEQAD
jgi:vacuolar-type H+-ATPase subunit F/Vma7